MQRQQTQPDHSDAGASHALKPAVTQIFVSGMKKESDGKVRTNFRVADRTILMVATDRLSAFDVVFNEGVPGKGWVLNNLSAFWFRQTKDIIDNHFLSIFDGPGEAGNGRAMFVERVRPLKIEAVVRGYLTGSGLKEYKATGALWGWGGKLPEGLKDGSRLPQPVFTPTTKAATGHDMPMSKAEVIALLGEKDAEFVERKAIELYTFGQELAARKGLVLADTKLEFGKRPDGTIILIDEILTPDSSRYWVGLEYAEGRLVSLDKQFVRDYLEKLGWNKKPPPPPLPAEVIAKTAQRYQEVYSILTGPDLRRE